jgi:hypothetical protein
MGCSSSGRHLLEIGSLKDSRCRLFFSMKSVGCKKSVCLQKKRLTAKKKGLTAKKAFACNFFVPAILSKADVKAQQALI